MAKMTQSTRGFVREYQRFLRLAFFAMIGAVFALVLTLGLASVRLEVAAREIAENAGPAIVLLSDADVELRRLRGYLEDRLEGNGDPVLVSVQLKKTRQALDEDIKSYLALPTFPGEREFAPQLAEGLADVQRSAEHIESLPSNPPNRDELERQLQVMTDALSNQLDEAARFNADYLHTAYARINEVRRITLPMATVINVLGFGLAAISLVIAVRLVHRYAEAEAEARMQLERRADELESFSAQVAHDLLSPLMTTNLAIVVAREKVPAEDQKTRQQLARAEMSLGHVRALVEGLFEFARADVDSSVKSSADLDRVLQEVESSFLPIAERDGIEFTIDSPTACRVAASPGVVGSMIGNLVQNSFRAVGKREIRRVVVHVADERRGDQNMVRISVEDTGEGVDPDIQSLLFQPHARNVRSRTSPGLGLGLATVKRLAERHGGFVGFHSQRGEGATFWFVLPCAEMQSSPPEAA